MRNKFLAVLTLVAVPVFASTGLFTKYETVRQGLLKQNLADVQSSARALAADAKKAKNEKIATMATSVSKAADLKAARNSFAVLSDEMIKLRNEAKGDRPMIGFCPMVNKSWLQAKGEVGNPYDPSMEKCGMLKE